MQKSSVTYCVAACLIAGAGIAIWYPRSDKADRPGEVGPDDKIAANASGAKSPQDRGLPSPPAADEPPLITDENGIVDPEDYDSDKDGYPEIQTYVRLYARLKTTAGKCDMLENARTLEPPDDPRINALLIEEAAHSDDPEVREAARDALLEYGEEGAHKELGSYLTTQTNIKDSSQLNETLDKLGHPSLKVLRSGTSTK